MAVPGTYAEAFTALAGHGVLAADLAQRIGDLVRVRNRIVRGYASADFERFWRELPAGIAALEEYSASIARWVDGLPA